MEDAIKKAFKIGRTISKAPKFAGSTIAAGQVKELLNGDDKKAVGLSAGRNSIEKSCGCISSDTKIIIVLLLILVFVNVAKFLLKYQLKMLNSLKNPKNDALPDV